MSFLCILKVRGEFICQTNPCEHVITCVINTLPLHLLKSQNLGSLNVLIIRNKPYRII